MANTPPTPRSAADTDRGAAAIQLDTFPTQQIHSGLHFPLVYRYIPSERDPSDSSEWLKNQRATLLEEANRHGAVLFRGFPIDQLEHFDAFVSTFERPCFTYADSLSNAVRVNHTPRVFSANEAPPTATINLHHELAQTPMYPRLLFFYCQQSPQSGGATSLCRSDILWERLSSECPDFAQACQDKGIKYSHTMPPHEDADSGLGRSWKSTFSVKTREEAEARMAALGYSGEWLPADCLRVTSPRLSAVRALGDGRTSFFNQLIAAYTGWRDSRNGPENAVVFGDGSPIDPQGAERAVLLGEELSFDLAWQPGDVALVDNFVTMHGRRTFKGQRSVLASFTT